MNRKFLFNFVLCFMLICAICIPAIADTEISPQYSHTKSIRANLSFKGDTALSSGSVAPQSYDSDWTARINVYLQRKEDGVWKNVDSWSGSKVNGMAAAGGEVTVAKGYSYRTYAVGRIYNKEGVLLERVTATSKTVSH